MNKILHPEEVAKRWHVRYAPGKELPFLASMASEFSLHHEELGLVMDQINEHLSVMNTKIVSFIDEIQTSMRGTTHSAEALSSRVLVIEHHLKALLPKVPEASPFDPIAVALRYHEDASLSIRASAGRPGALPEDQTCESCQFAQETCGNNCHCMLFPGKTVNCGGWCCSWTLKASRFNQK